LKMSRLIPVKMLSMMLLKKKTRVKLGEA
jgi:hypothetical protein